MLGMRLGARGLGVCARRLSDKAGERHHEADPSFKGKLVAPDLGKAETKPVSLEDVIHPHGPRPTSITVAEDESSQIGGMPETQSIQRRARIFKPAREATQTAWNNTKIWKIELDNQERWENPNIGWASSADPMSSLGMHMKFARCEDAIHFCEKNGWEYEVVEPQERAIRPKNYAENFHWSKKTRIGCK